MRFESPLRYPGGKRKIAEFVKDIITINDVQGGTYVEPFAGGGSVALYLLFNEYVNKIILNDLDRSIYAFWHSVLNKTDELIKMIKEVTVNMDEWERQRFIQLNKENVDLLELGFSTFFLNRTNRSGIITAGVIGGKKQTGKWKMDARFNKSTLIKRIKRIALYRDRIDLYGLDAMIFVEKVSSKIDDNTLIYFDPPYYNRGSTLYVNHYKHEDHELLSKFIQQLNCKWMLTYDYTSEIIDMYSDVERRILTLSYSAAEKTKGNEMLAFSPGLNIPEGKYSAIAIKQKSS